MFTRITLLTLAAIIKNKCSMKQVQFYLLVALGLVAASCSIKEDRLECQAPVSVQVNDFAISQTGLDTKATQAVADYSAVKALTLAFYDSGGTEVYKASQLRDSMGEGETFGNFSLSLPMDSYTMVVLGYGLKEGEPAITLTSPTSASFGEHPARETFAHTQTVNITNTSAVDISATLNRIVSKLQVASNDVRPDGATSVRMSFSAGSKDFNPTTGLSLSNSGFSNAVGITSNVGASSLSNSYLFLNADEQTLDVTIDVLDSDGNVLYTHPLQDIPFKRNRTTKLSGTLYANPAISGSFRFETDWLSDENLSF